jgi:hypothetical protein
MLSTENPRRMAPAAALVALNADDFHALVRANLGREADPALWDALTDPAVIARTRVALTAINSDVENQLALAGATLDQASGKGKHAYYDAKAEQAEWRRRALGMRRMVQQRIILVKSRIPRPPPQPRGTGMAKRLYAETLETLARAVADHRDKVTSGEGDQGDDDALWALLDQLPAPDGRGGEQSLTEWLAFLDEAREDGE